jgi:hypothetical protein
MAHVELTKAILTKLYTILTEDSILKSAMGGTVKIYPVWAKDDTVMPYLVHRIESSASSDFWPIRQGTYILDIWSGGTNADEALTIRDRIMTLLDEQSWDLTDSTTKLVKAMRMWLQTEGFVTEDDTEIWHLATQWNIRLYRTAEVANIISR